MDLVPKPNRLYNLDRDCLQMIFSYLEVDDLINLADALSITYVNIQNMLQKKSETNVNQCIQFADVLANTFLKKNGFSIQVTSSKNSNDEFGFNRGFNDFYDDDDDFDIYSSDDSSEASLEELNIDNILNNDNNDGIDSNEANFNLHFMQMILKESKKGKGGKCPPILRSITYFGHVVTEIIVKYDKLLGKLPSKLDEIILTTCRESLVSIVLDDVRSDSLSMISQPFPNVEKVKISNGILSGKLSKFNDWFPKMRSLHLHQCIGMPEKFIEYHFAHLEELKVETTNDWGVNKINLKTAFDLNPQLRSLSLSGISLDKPFLLYIENKLKFLNNLTLDISDWIVQVKNVPDVVAIDSLVSLQVLGHATTLPKIVITSKQLVQFGYMEYSFSDSNFLRVANVVKNNRNIQILHISHGSFVEKWENRSTNTTLNMIKLINELPKLEEIIMFDQHWQENIDETAENIVDILTNCERITNLKICDTRDHIYLEHEEVSELMESIRNYAMIREFDITSWDIETGIYEGGIIYESKRGLISLKRKTI